MQRSQAENTERVRQIIRGLPPQVRPEITMVDINELVEAIEEEDDNRLERWIKKWKPHLPQST